MKDTDSLAVLHIYSLGLDTKNATFETKVPSWEEWDANHHKHSRFVYEEDNKVLGWVALSPVSRRAVYSGVAEVSLYVDINYSGRGIGTKLMQNVIESSELNGIWTLNSAIFPENTASYRLHNKCGFRKVGIRRKIAKLHDQWRDTLILERRSKVVGI
jgi:L-amino acid N-acyltransferase YncA